VDEHGEALGRDLGRDELGGGEPHTRLARLLLDMMYAFLPSCLTPSTSMAA
jgi:hypothetical protein